MKSILTTITILFFIFAANAQQIDWEDSLARLYSNVHAVKTCGSIYTIVDEEPQLRALLKQKLDAIKLNDDMFYSSFTLYCDINCNGDIGNWRIGINNGQSGLDKATAEKEFSNLVYVLEEVAKVLPGVSTIKPCTYKDKPVDYSKQIPIRIEDGKIRIRGTD